jgi:hypothetical protein
MQQIDFRRLRLLQSGNLAKKKGSILQFVERKAQVGKTIQGRKLVII